MANKKDIERCPWCGDDPLYQDYHDNVWGVPVHDDQTLFEFLTLEGAQAGLSWITVLRKRENYRAAFDGFDPAKIARYSEKRQEKLLQNPGIIRNRLKVSSTVTNAQAFLAVQAEYGTFNDYIWAFVEGQPIVNRFKTMADVPASTPLAETISKDLKKRGFRFVGPTIVYAHMQATGMVNDHLLGCHRHKACAKLK
ncbi:MAG: DNA-3-methyladenine glycosylase I [Gammaproteobacteria bacterium]|nr:DNA-3-methyladenine glycosylase I [Gammaproteobacteria bacterium]MBQ0774239.1 DNA-3-methyladenine glycosylase I [Gammaproteobacteria bacterium]